MISREVSLILKTLPPVKENKGIPRGLEGKAGILPENFKLRTSNLYIKILLLQGLLKKIHFPLKCKAYQEGEHYLMDSKKLKP